MWSLLIALRSKHVSNIQSNSSNFILQWHNSTVALALIKSHHSDYSNGLGLQFPSLQTRQAYAAACLDADILKASEGWGTNRD